MKIALAFATLAACTIPGSYGYGPQAPQLAPAATVQKDETPKADPVAPDLDGIDADEIAQEDEDESELAPDGSLLKAATASAWVKSGVGDRLCFLNQDPFLGQGSKLIVQNKTDRLHLAYALNGSQKPNLIILKESANGRWIRNDNGHGQTVLPPRSSCVFEAKGSRTVNFLAYGYVNEGSAYVPSFRAAPDAVMKRPETIRVNPMKEYTAFPLSSYRFK